MRDASALTGLPLLERVHLLRTTLTDLAFAATLPQLRELALRFSLKLVELAPLAGLSELRALDLYDFKLGVRSLRRLQAAESFDELLLLADCDRRGRVRGVIVPDVLEALQYVRDLAVGEE